MIFTFNLMLFLQVSSLLLLQSITFCNAAASTKPPPDDKTVLLALHNKLRSSVGSSDMQVLSWNDSMVADAKGCATGTCGCPAAAPTTLTYVPVPGMVIVQQPTANPKNVTEMLLKAFNAGIYNYATKSCKPQTDSCTSYTQILAADTTQFACYNTSTTTECATATVFVCVYDPVFDPSTALTQPYKKGDPCTQCSNGAFWCTKDKLLCNKTCGIKDKCTCVSKCRNCGVLNKTSCTCLCGNRTGVDCTGPCRNNTHPHCDSVPNDLGACSVPDLAPWMTDLCQATCNSCPPSRCPAGYGFRGETVSCYKIAYVTDPLSRSDAQKICEKDKGHLVFIESDADIQALLNLWPFSFSHAFDIVDYTGSMAAWIGGCRFNNKNDTDSFRWSAKCDQGTFADKKTPIMDYVLWPLDGSEPNHFNFSTTNKDKKIGEWCVEMRGVASASPAPPLEWNDVDCRSLRHVYICEADPQCPKK